MTGAESGEGPSGKNRAAPSAEAMSLPPAEVLLAAEAVMANNPDAYVTGIDWAGHQVPIPDTINTSGCRLLEGAIVDMIPAEDVTDAVFAFERARDVGVARCQVRLMADGGRQADYRVFNLHETHELFLRVVVPHVEVDDDVFGPPRPDAVFTPRFCTVIKDDVAAIVDVDPAFTAMFGFDAAECVGGRSLTFIHPDDHQIAVQAWMHMRSNTGQPRPVKLRHRHADGRWIWTELVNYNRLEEEGVVRADIADITDQMAAQNALIERERLLHTLAETLPVGVVQLAADGALAYANGYLRELLGSSRLDGLDGLALSVVEADRSRFTELFTNALGFGIDGEVEVRLTSPGSQICSVTVRCIENDVGEVTAVIGCITDITEQAELQQTLRYQATYDPLTRCANRASTLHALTGALNDGRPVGVVFIDLDRFKPVNDRHGHAVGDELLVALVDRLRLALRDDDTIGRIGGDEFLLVVPGIDGPAAAERLARRVALALADPVELTIGAVQPRASLGIAWSTTSMASADELIARADDAMYAAKADEGRRAEEAIPTGWALASC